ncbi:FMN-dependent NADH-azoreductase [Moorena sp. SIO4E2]|uniref:FMN-dependent NADH-azoreductase n=1 Tax=Moorena sp. SIO4E2 TaxID=2607826 RepID=UPI00257DCFF2|nr:FMN-dependent NADH-azoreductase [Moorena sp. SIO4E2]
MAKRPRVRVQPSTYPSPNAKGKQPWPKGHAFAFNQTTKPPNHLKPWPKGHAFAFNFQLSTFNFQPNNLQPSSSNQTTKQPNRQTTFNLIMTHILHIDASPRGDRSISRQLSNRFIQTWKSFYPDDTVSYRDLGHNPVPHVDEKWIAAAFCPPEKRTPELVETIKVSDTLVDELLAADRYVFGIPMYNFNVPSTFKAYIDQIVRFNRTFTFDEPGQYRGLVPKGKKMLIFTARGGSFSPGTPSADYDYHEPFLRAIFGVIGITDITFIHAEKLDLGEEARQQSLANARAELEKAVGTW